MQSSIDQTQPYVLRCAAGSNPRWALSVDESHNLGHPIDREFDEPSFRVRGAKVTDQQAMRRGLIMTESQHRHALERGGQVVLASIGNGNLLANYRFVAWWKGRLLRLADERIYQQHYTCMVAWLGGRVTIEDVWFGSQAGGHTQVFVKRNGGVEEISGQIDFATSGQQLVRRSVVVPLSQMTEQFYDTRHLVNPIRIPVNGSTLFVPNAQLQQGLLRQAVDSPIRVAIESAVDEVVRIPLSLKGWLRMADEDRPALDRAQAYLKAHELLDSGEDLSDRAVLLRVGGKLEQLLLDGLKGAKYTVVDQLRPLREGECSFVNGHLELYCKKAVYPHSVFVRFVDGATGAVIYPGKSGRRGWTLPAIQRHLLEELGVEDALLLDNGGDVRLWFRGCPVVRSSEGRPQIRAMLGLVTAAANSRIDAVSVS